MADYGKLLPENPLVSVIIDTYYRPELLKRAVNCILEQSYRNIELIIVNNAATSETIRYLSELERQNKGVVFVHFKENQFSWDDPHMIVRICYNAGLEVATGDIVFYQSDDDWVAGDFIERMVKLFVENPKCTTAIGRVVNSLSDGTILNMYPVKERETYIDGHLLALDFLNGTHKLVQPNPGHSFVIKRDILIKQGGFQDIFEYHQMLGIVPFGVTAFDPEALMFWGRGPEQLNVKLNNMNSFFWGSYFINNIKHPRYSLIKMWRDNFGEKEASKVEKYLHTVIMQAYYRMVFTNFFNGRLNTKSKFTSEDLEYMKNIPFEHSTLLLGLKESLLRSRINTYAAIGKHTLKMLFKSPALTMTKIALKLFGRNHLFSKG
jgi:glycosyltransferase involved in cell wall biosynthesis